MNPLFWPFLVALLGVSLVAVLGIRLTELGDWYEALRKPGWKPPDAWFGPIWTTIFLLQAAAMALAWVRAPDLAARWPLVAAFVLTGALNVTWNLLFFTWRRPDWAQWEVIGLWLSIVLLMVVIGRLHPWAAWLLLPYLAWVSLAGWLTRWIVRANGPFA